jgi:hypothetical protein
MPPMPSPFPGMDPYLEPHWRDIHSALIGDARRHLNRNLPKGLFARIEERVAVESEDDYTRGLSPDVRVFTPSTADPAAGKDGIVIEAPFKLVVELDPIIERFIRILDDSGTLITVIELLSPTNKRSPGLEQYRTKRGELLAAGVHVVEVDLVRQGNWRALMRPEQCPPDALSTYRAIVRTAGAKPGAYLFPISVRQPLPEIPIPLRQHDVPVRLPLQSLLTDVYDDGRYAETVDYSSPPDPAFHPEDMAWIDQLLKSAGKR